MQHSYAFCRENRSYFVYRRSPSHSIAHRIRRCYPTWSSSWLSCGRRSPSVSWAAPTCPSKRSSWGSPVSFISANRMRLCRPFTREPGSSEFRRSLFMDQTSAGRLYRAWAMAAGEGLREGREGARAAHRCPPQHLTDTMRVDHVYAVTIHPTDPSHSLFIL